MKKFEYTNEGKLKLSTGFKTFDKQTNYLGTGNVCANTQFSWYIRPTYETECNGFSFKEGDLFKSDIKNFRLSSHIKKMIQEFTDKNSGSILYSFTYRKRGEDVKIGYLITSKDNKKYHIFGAKNIKIEECMYALLPYFIKDASK